MNWLLGALGALLYLAILVRVLAPVLIAAAIIVSAVIIAT